jgi:hypothetical protein
MQHKLFTNHTCFTHNIEINTRYTHYQVYGKMIVHVFPLSPTVSSRVGALALTALTPSPLAPWALIAWRGKRENLTINHQDLQARSTDICRVQLIGFSGQTHPSALESPAVPPAERSLALHLRSSRLAHSYSLLLQYYYTVLTKLLLSCSCDLSPHLIPHTPHLVPPTFASSQVASTASPMLDPGFGNPYVIA